MIMSSLNHTISAQQKTAFTSIFIGVFLNDSTIQITGSSAITEDSIYRQYGLPLLNALDVFSEFSSLEQVYVIQSLKR